MKVSKKILIIATIVMGIALTAGFLGINHSQANALYEKSNANFMDSSTDLSDTLYVGINVPYWPYEYFSGTQIIGHDISLMNALAVELEVTVEYITVPWDMIFNGLIAGEYDAVISALTLTPEREATIDFSLPYESLYTPEYGGDLAIAVRQGDSALRTQINQALIKVRENGTLETIIEATNVDLSSRYSDTWAALPDWPEVLTNSDTTFIYTDTQGSPMMIDIPGGAITDAILLTYNPLSADNISSNFTIAGRVFDLDAYQDGTFLSEGVQFNSPVTITMVYSDSDVVGLVESSLELLVWDDSAKNWVEAACGDTVRNIEENWLAVPICHLSRFALTGDNSLFLPILIMMQIP